MPEVCAARDVYDAAIETAAGLWSSAAAGGSPCAAAADKIVDALASSLTEDAPALLALTSEGSQKDDCHYTFAHMVNVTILTLAQVHGFGIDGPLRRTFGVAALLHDIGKVKTPPAILHKPQRLTAKEFAIIKRHVIDGAAILQRTPGVSPLAAVVAFEHHLKEDLTGYPEGLPPRRLNLCTQMVTIADVFDALRNDRPYRPGLTISLVHTIMSEQDLPAFNRPLLMRFIELMKRWGIG